MTNRFDESPQRENYATGIFLVKKSLDDEIEEEW